MCNSVQKFFYKILLFWSLLSASCFFYEILFNRRRHKRHLNSSTKISFIIFLFYAFGENSINRVLGRQPGFNWVLSLFSKQQNILCSSFLFKFPKNYQCICNTAILLLECYMISLREKYPNAEFFLVHIWTFFTQHFLGYFSNKNKTNHILFKYVHKIDVLYWNIAHKNVYFLKCFRRKCFWCH